MVWTKLARAAALIAFAYTAAAQEPAKPRIDWKTTYQEGIALAQKLEKPVLIDFYASWCGPCKMMDEQVFPDPAVIKVMDQFVNIKVDIDADEKTALAYGVRSIPRTVVLNIHGEMVGDRIGFMESESYIAFLKDTEENLRRKVDGVVIEVPTDVPETIVFTPDTELAEVMKVLAAPKKDMREKAREALLAMDANVVKRWMRQALASEYLGERIAAKETLIKLEPGTWNTFDPWAPEADRARRLAARE